MTTLHAPTPSAFALFTAAPDRDGDASRRATAAAAAARLGPVCAGWPPDQFAELLADVVQFHQRWAAWDAAP